MKTWKAEEHVVKKKWGEEVILHNSLDYCAKLLRFKSGKKFSLHFHVVKNETWYVSKGRFLLNYIQVETGERDTITILPGTVIDVPKGHPHQLMALEDGEIFEASTMHYDWDSYRIEKGDSQL